MMEAEGPSMGSLEIVTWLQARRREINAIELHATFHTKHGDIEIVTDERGFSMYADGRPVPMKKETETS